MSNPQLKRLLQLALVIFTTLLFFPASTHAQPASATGWTKLNYGVSGTVRSIVPTGNTIYLAGAFDRACGNDACDTDNQSMPAVGTWDGSTWSAVHFGMNNSASTVALNGTDLYAGGLFDYTCLNDGCHNLDVRVNHAAKWDGTTWSALKKGLSDGASAVAVNGSDVYFGGAFRDACGSDLCDTDNTRVNRVAKWNGTTWSALGNGLNAGVTALVVLANNLYAVGDFTGSCDDSDCSTVTGGLNHVAEWNGSNWIALGFGVNQRANAIVTDGTNLYIAGDFYSICGNADCNSSPTPAFHVAKWDGTAWSQVGFGVNQTVAALTVNGSWLYLGGDLTGTCDDSTCSTVTPANHIAAWNGAKWYALENGVNAQVTALTASGTDLFVGGVFTLVCGNSTCDTNNTTVNHIAEYQCAQTASKPILKQPANKGTITITTPKLKWNASTCAVTYNVTVKDTATGKTVDSKNGILKTQYKTKALKLGKTYKWVVQACNSFGCAKSKAWKFTVQ